MIAAFVLFFLLSRFLAHGAFAQIATPKATPTAIKSVPTNQDKIEDLKERIATKVAELRQTQKQALSGTVRDVSVSTISIETQTKEVKIEMTDDLAVYQTIRGKRTKLTTDDVDEGDFVVVFGDFDSGLEILEAKLIVIQAAPPERINGTVTDVSQEAFTITAITSGERSVIVDFEKTTNLNVWSKETGIAKAGFSKIAVGDTIHVVGTAVAKKENRMSATRILDLGNLTGAQTTAPTPTPTPEP